MKTEWAKLENSYLERGIVPVLGAGVSVGCGLPDWTELLRRLHAGICAPADPDRFRELLDAGFSLPAVAGFLEQSCESPGDFVDFLRDALYRDFPFYRKSDVDRAEFIEYVSGRNPTMKAVAALCVRKEGSFFTPNPRVRAVVNFNLDAVFRAYVRKLYARDGRDILRTTERPSAGAIQGRIPVYHMHGFLSFKESHFGRMDKEAPDIRVLTEQEYFDFFDNPNSMFNYTFLYLLREFSCVFIGMSLKDDNLRRLLHYSVKERRASYAREGKQEGDAWRNIRHFAFLSDPGIPGVRRANELLLNRLGVQPLWLKTFSELPERMGKLYSSGGDGWDSVHRPDMRSILAS